MASVKIRTVSIVLLLSAGYAAYSRRVVYDRSFFFTVHKARFKPVQDRRQDGHRHNQAGHHPPAQDGG
jgi:hypothetical protein